MRNIFKPSKFIEIPDGTLLSPFLNPKDSNSQLPFDLIDGFSIAQGKVEGNTISQIHVHPHVDQVTYVLSGSITLKMKGYADEEPYSLELEANESAISTGGEFFQLVNVTAIDCLVLYIVSPAYLFEINTKKEVIYDDSIILDYSWDELELLRWSPEEFTYEKHSKEERVQSYQRIQESKSRQL